MPEIKIFARMPMTPEQNAEIARIAAMYGLPKERAISVLASYAAGKESVGEGEIKKILKDAGAHYRVSRTKKKPAVKVRKFRKTTGVLVGS